MSTPWTDPIVEETRARGRQLATAAGNDMHAYFEHLRRVQEHYAARVVDRIESAGQSASAGPRVAS